MTPDYRSAPQYSYFQCAGLQHKTIQLMIALSGRAHTFPQLTGWLKKQSWPKHQIQLLLCDTSRCDRFGDRVRQWAANSGYNDVRVILFDPLVKPGIGDEDRSAPEQRVEVNQAVARIYTRLAQEAKSPYILIVEDDVIPPLDVVSKLLSCFEADVVSVTGVYRSRSAPNRLLHWGENGVMVKENGQVGIQPVFGNGFGCVMLTREVFKGETFTSFGEPHWYDTAFYQRLQGRRLVNYGCWCEHLDKNGEPV